MQITKLINAKLNNELVTIEINNKKFSKIIKQDGLVNEENALDLNSYIITPPFVESHIHLDTTNSAGVYKHNESGTLFEGIAIWSETKKTLNKEVLRERIIKTLEMQISAGVLYVRTHVDITDPTLLALHVINELKQEYAHLIQIQIIAFPQEGILSYPNGMKLLEQAIEVGVDGLGAIPHFEDCYEYGVESLKLVFEKAVQHNLLIDAHCDEIDDENSRFLEVMASLAIQYDYGKYVTASHTTAMGSYNDAYVSRLMKTLKKSGINFVSNPLVNMHLGGRFDTYPKRRGLTRIKQLKEHNLNVSFGHDDIFDPWYPIGNANMLQVAHMGIHAEHLMGIEEITSAINFVTINGARTLNLDDYGIKVGNSANFIVLEAKEEIEIMQHLPKPLYVVRDGKILVKSPVRNTQIFY